MENIYISILIKSLSAGVAALGFGILFNIPRKVILTVLFLGFLAGLIKFTFLNLSFTIISSTFFASLFVGILSIPLAKRVHKPIVVFSIPSIIPMIPGFYAYKTILAIRNFTFLDLEGPDSQSLLNSIFTNGFMTLFILFAITVGVSAPMLILGRDMARKLND